MSRYIFAALVLLSVVCGLHAACQEKVGGGCWAGHQCCTGLQCEAWTHICKGAGKEGEGCHLTRHCAPGLQCEAGTHTCKGPGKEGEGCHATRQCAPGLQCEAWTHTCKRPGKEDEGCHLTRQCGEGHICIPLTHKCQRMGNIGEQCVPSSFKNEGRICNIEKQYWCDPFTRTCIPPSRRGNVCGYLGDKEDHGQCQSGLSCQCNWSCSIVGILKQLQGSLSGVASTIQDVVGKDRFCCKCG